MRFWGLWGLWVSAAANMCTPPGFEKGSVLCVRLHDALEWRDVAGLGLVYDETTVQKLRKMLRSMANTKRTFLTQCKYNPNKVYLGPPQKIIDSSELVKQNTGDYEYQGWERLPFEVYDNLNSQLCVGSGMCRDEGHKPVMVHEKAQTCFDKGDLEKSWEVTCLVYYLGYRNFYIATKDCHTKCKNDKEAEGVKEVIVANKQEGKAYCYEGDSKPPKRKYGEVPEGAKELEKDKNCVIVREVGHEDKMLYKGCVCPEGLNLFDIDPDGFDFYVSKPKD